MLKWRILFWKILFIAINFNAASAEVLTHQVLVGSQDVPILRTSSDAKVVLLPKFGVVEVSSDVVRYTPTVTKNHTDWIEFEADGLRQRIAVRISETYAEFHDESVLRRGPVQVAPGLLLRVSAFGELPVQQDTGFARHALSAAPIGDALLVSTTGAVGDATLAMFSNVGELLDQLAIHDIFLESLGLVLDASDALHGGLRGIAVHPDFTETGLIYLSAMVQAGTGKGTYLIPQAENDIFDAVLVELQLSVDDFAKGKFTTIGARTVFKLGLVTQKHGIRQIAFNPWKSRGAEGYDDLFVAFGDNASKDTPDHERAGIAPFGSVLKLNPTAEHAHQLTDIVFAEGLRNPHNLAFLPDGRLFIVDIGRDNFEEINLARGGENFGWPDREGPFQHLDAGGRGDGIAAAEKPFELTDPIAFLSHPKSSEDTGRLFALTGGGPIILPDGETGFILANFTFGGEVFLLRQSEIEQAYQTKRPAKIEQLNISYDHDRYEGTTRRVSPSLTDLVYYLRSDARLHRLNSNQIAITTKSTSTIFKAEIVSTRP